MSYQVSKRVMCEDGIVRSVRVNQHTDIGVLKFNRVSYSGQIVNGKFVINPYCVNGNPFRKPRKVYKDYREYMKVTCEDGRVRTAKVDPLHHTGVLKVGKLVYSGRYNPTTGMFVINPHCKNGNPFIKSNVVPFDSVGKVKGFRS